MSQQPSLFAGVRAAWRSRRPVPLSHSEALDENGFTVFRGLFSAPECAALAARMKAEAGIEEGVRFTRTDAINHYVSCREVLFDARTLDAVRQSIGTDGRFLQVADLHYRHDAANWHRDSVHRSSDASAAPDWSPGLGRFGVVKAILYLESDNAAMGVMPGSHLSPIEMDRAHVKDVEDAGGHLVLGPSADPNRRLSAADRRRPLVWQAGVGDVLVFDERLYHCGRRVDGATVSARKEAAKFTVSLVFGADNAHSERMYSYFRYARRELRYTDLPDDLRRRLADRDLVLTAGWGNYYEQHPEDIRLAELRHPEQVEDLVREFTAAGQR